MEKSFFISVPHSGESIPQEVTWLQGLNEVTLMRDVDRFVDRLYAPVIDELGLYSITTPWHRYFADLNRSPDDIDQDSVVGAPSPSGTHTTGLHWVKTTQGESLMRKPIFMELHNSLVEKYFKPFHQQIRSAYKKFSAAPGKNVYHLDAHSMPSKGTKAHRDPGENRAEIVISDQDGTSCSEFYKELVINAYKSAGFEVAYNWPYKGGKITQTYGRPQLGQQTIQVEMNRKLYMDENSKQWLNEKALSVQNQLRKAIRLIFEGL